MHAVVPASADLVPVFSFGENDVSLAHGHGLSHHAETERILPDIPADAQREGHDRIRATEEVPEHVWVYATTFPWPGVVELWALLCCLSIYALVSRLDSDNLGLLPYRRRIVAVSKYLSSITAVGDADEDSICQSGAPYT